MVDIVSVLIEGGHLNQEQGAAIQTRIAAGESFDAFMAEYQITPDAVVNALGTYYSLPVRQLTEHETLEHGTLEYVPEDSAEHYKILPLGKRGGVMEVGIVDPDELKAMDALNFIASRTNLPYKLFLISEDDFKRGLEMYGNLTGEVTEALTELESDVSVTLEDEEEKPKEEQINEEHIKEDAPVTKIVATILRYAVDGSASDIHLEPLEDKVQVRFRIDGVLTTSLELPGKVRSAAVARIKILSSMRLDEKRKPQDGRFSARIDDRKIDFRVSTLPTNYGEKVVMRILDSEGGVRKLDDTGISPYNLELIRKAIQQPYGIILISGPTGSGKSSTLYGLLNEVDKLGKNVISLEDPVEFNIDGVSQSQMRPDIGYTFAEGLRSVLRQDPDIIMVGEIRDKETAQLAIQAALTGHLVLSTIHTNTTIGVAPRLIDMGVDPYLIAPTLILAAGQRLVRRICPGSGLETPVEGSLKQMVDHEFENLPEQYRDRIPTSNSVMKLQSTPECPNGTRGRIAVTEVLEVTDKVERAILDSVPEDKMYSIARQNGFVSMKEDAIIKALNHEIPFEEVNALGANFMVSKDQALPSLDEPTLDQQHAFEELQQAVDNQKEV